MKRLRGLLGPIAVLGMIDATSAASDPATPRPPMAPKRPRIEVVHGDRRVDDYYWLREKGNPEVIAYLEAENAYAEVLTKQTRELQESLYHELLGRIKQTDLSVPYREGDFFYYTRTEEGRQYSIYCRKRGGLDAPEEVLLDLNLLAVGRPFMAVGAFTVSGDGRWLAFSTDTTGFRVYNLHVKDLQTGAITPDQARDVGSVAWATDRRTLFYTVKDGAKRPYRLLRHRVGTAAHDLLYEETDEKFTLAVRRSRSQAYLLLASESHTASEVRFLPADRPGDAWTLIAAREPEHEYDVDHHGDRFYIRTNQNARNFRLVSAPVSDPGKLRWTEVVPHRTDVMLEGVECFAHHLVLVEREDGLVRFRITDLRTRAEHRVEFPEPVYSAQPSTNREFETSVFRYGYQSFVTPSSVFDYDMEQHTSTLLKQTEVLGGYDPSHYHSERQYALAPDGTRIPISIVYRKNLKRNAAAPLLLYGYGAYGNSLSASFSSNRLSLLDRGMIYAIAHVRGGGELGKAWHDQGRMKLKRNTFSDFIAVAEYLIEEKLTSKKRLAIQGGSAGGLLVGAVTNLRPDLFKVVVSQVPFVDVINTMRDPSLPLTVGEFEEWGNPAQPGDYQVMKAYCPYTNLAPQRYPTMLVKTSLNDSQVMYWEPAKYVARLRVLKTDANPLVFKVNMGAGHGGASGRYDALRETAYDYAFLLTQLGIERPAPAGAIGAR